MFNDTKLIFSSDVNQDTYEKDIKTQENTTHKRAKRLVISHLVTTRLQVTDGTA